MCSASNRKTLLDMKKVVIVSDSSLLCEALAVALRPVFATVEYRSELDFSESGEDLKATVFVIDAADVTTIVNKLSDVVPHARLEHTVILMRSRQAARDFLAVVDRVGALLPHDSTAEEVSMAARLVRKGLHVIPNALFDEISGCGDEGMPETTSDRAALTSREDSVLSLIAEGFGNKMIARKLDISDSTVRVHVRSILKKLGVQNRTQAALQIIGTKRKSKS